MKKYRISLFYCLIGIISIFLCKIYKTQLTSVFSETLSNDNRHCIIIDAGHGGEDGGAVSCTGVFEADINLQIAKRLNCLLRLLGLDTHMLRSENTALYTEGRTLLAKKVSDLKNRVQTIRTFSHPILISIHQNIFSDSRYHGAQVFYNTAGQNLASQIQSDIKNHLDRQNNRKSKKASGIYLLDNTQCEAVLIECGFLSNPEEEKLLQDAGYQKKLCCVLAATLSVHLSQSTTV